MAAIVRTYRIGRTFVDDHHQRGLPETAGAVSRVVRYAGRMAIVELDSIGARELADDATYYAEEMSSAGYGDAAIIAAARRTIAALKRAGAPLDEAEEEDERDYCPGGCGGLYPDGCGCAADGAGTLGPASSLMAARGVFIPALADVMAAVVSAMRASSPGSALGAAAYDAAAALGDAIAAARSFPMDVSGL